MRKIKILIACEYSGATRRAFEKRWGDMVDVMSCDLLPADDGASNHYKGDVFDIINNGFDFMLGHPPCTYLTNSGVRWLYDANGEPTDRWQDMYESSEFFKRLLNADIPYIALENPIMHKHALAVIGVKPDQYIQPWQFGHAESKRTGLWLQNLPLLQETHNVYDKFKTLPKKEAQRLHMLPPSADRWKIRSETFAGIAEAIADQYGSYVINKIMLDETGHGLIQAAA